MTSRPDGDNASLDTRAMALAEAALEAPADARRTYITAHSEGDAALRERALSLLTLVEAEEGSIVTGGGLTAFDDFATPERLGNYRIEREIGRGGMGAVYLGRREAADFEHMAAIKLVRLDGRTGKLSERLRSERRLLARLKHPHIAQFHDGGETEEGAPYFVMEYVEGAPLYRYLDEHAPPLAARLKIFRDVCEAVAYAHCNLVIHRDLSPANILVTDDGVAKVIDFGVSHTIGGDEAEAAPRRMLTAGYASPERRRDEPATTLDDVYSLGVILREMIEGLDAPRRADLVAIAAKASADDAAHRHNSVEGLLDDVVRYEAGRMVSAMRSGWGYALRRFVGRHQLGVAVAAAALIGVVGASVTTGLLYLRAEQAEAQAVKRFDEVRSLARFMLFDLHDEIAGIPGSTRARESLADTARRYLDTLSATPGASRSLKVETAIGYKRLADVVGVPSGANLGRREEAGELLEIATQELAALRAEAPDDPAVLRAVAQTAFSYAVYNFISVDDSAKSMVKAQEAVAAWRALRAIGAATVDDLIGLADAMALHGGALAWENRGEEGVAMIADAVALIDSLLAVQPDDARLARARAEAAVGLGDAKSRHADFTGGGYEASLASLDDGVDRYRALSVAAPDDWELLRSLASSLWKRARVLYSMDRDADALLDLAEAENYANTLIARDSEDLGVFRFRLLLLSQRALALAYLGRLEEAVAVSREGIAGRRLLASLQPGNPGHVKEIVDAISALGEILTLAGDHDGACGAAAEAAAILEPMREARNLGEYGEAQFVARIERLMEDCLARGLVAAP